MPVVAMIDDVKICFYFEDHPPAHFHALFAEHEAKIEVATLTVIKGRLPRTKLAKAWWALIDHPPPSCPAAAGYPRLSRIVELYAQVVDTREDAGMTARFRASRSRSKVPVWASTRQSVLFDAWAAAQAKRKPGRIG